MPGNASWISATHWSVSSLEELLAARSYSSFAGIDSESEGQVKFVYRTEAIEVPEA